MTSQWDTPNSTPINDEDDSARTSLDFLGEHYCLVSKCRSLTDKSVKKLFRIQEILDRFNDKKEAKMKCRLFMAIIGSLLCCGEVLAVDLSKHIAARCHAEAAAEAGRLQSWDHKIRVGACAISQLVPPSASSCNGHANACRTTQCMSQTAVTH